MKLAKVAALIAVALFAMGAATSNDPAERLPDLAKEARARAMFREVRCLECQNESIDDSEAPIASDLRRAVREQVSAGRSNAEIKHYLTDRYGEFVLMRPTFSLGNALLWLTPFAIVLGGGAVMILRVRRAPPPVAPLSDAEQNALADLDGVDAEMGDQAFAIPAPDEKSGRISKAGARGTSVRRQGT